LERLEELKRGAIIEGLHPTDRVSIIDVVWHGSDVLEVTYRDSQGNLQMS